MTTSPCCPPGSLPFLANKPGRGSFITIKNDNRDDMQCYVTKEIGSSDVPTANVIVIFTDVYGINSGNHQSFADQLEDEMGPETVVVMPDLFRGSPALQPWTFVPKSIGLGLATIPMLARLKFRFSRTKTINMDVQQIILPWIKKMFGPKKVACVGFCYGGWCVAQSLALDATDYDCEFACGVGIHPSFNVETIHGRDEESLAKQIQKPMLLLPAGNDSKAVHLGGSVVRTLAKKRCVEESQVCIEFPSMIHGFCSRGNGEKDDLVRQEQERAIRLTVNFLHANM